LQKDGDKLRTFLAMMTKKSNNIHHNIITK